MLAHLKRYKKSSFLWKYSPPIGFHSVLPWVSESVVLKPKGIQRENKTLQKYGFTLELSNGIMLLPLESLSIKINERIKFFSLALNDTLARWLPLEFNYLVCITEGAHGCQISNKNRHLIKPPCFFYYWLLIVVVSLDESTYKI